MQKKIRYKEIGFEDLENLENLQKKYTDEINNIWTCKELKNHIKKKTSFSRVSKCGGKTIGFLLSLYSEHLMDIFLIFVTPEFRGRGVAKNFLKDIKEFCKLNFINKITLEVNEDNQAAYFLYLKFGFKIIGKRKDYYFMNKKKSDAIIMELNL